MTANTVRRTSGLLALSALLILNGASRNFLVFRWQDVAVQVKPALKMAGAEP
jgi:hypothetical protein